MLQSRCICMDSVSNETFQQSFFFHLSNIFFFLNRMLCSYYFRLGCNCLLHLFSMLTYHDFETANKMSLESLSIPFTKTPILYGAFKWHCDHRKITICYDNAIIQPACHGFGQRCGFRWWISDECVCVWVRARGKGIQEEEREKEKETTTRSPTVNGSW